MIQVCPEMVELKNKLLVVEGDLREGRIGDWTRSEPMRVKDSESCSCVLVFDTRGPGDYIVEHRNKAYNRNELMLTGKIHVLMLT